MILSAFYWILDATLACVLILSVTWRRNRLPPRLHSIRAEAPEAGVSTDRKVNRRESNIFMDQVLDWDNSLFRMELEPLRKGSQKSDIRLKDLPDI